jgi:hypothetical protein
MERVQSRSLVVAGLDDQDAFVQIGVAHFALASFVPLANAGIELHGQVASVRKPGHDRFELCNIDLSADRHFLLLLFPAGNQKLLHADPVDVKQQRARWLLAM